MPLSKYVYFTIQVHDIFDFIIKFYYNPEASDPYSLSSVMIIATGYKSTNYNNVQLIIKSKESKEEGNTI